MCYCGKCFDNSLEVAAHNGESHKDEYTSGYEGGQDPYVTKAMMINVEHVQNVEHVHTVHLKLFNKTCKYADRVWPGCAEEAERLQHYVRKHGEEHPEITCQSCKATL